MIRKYIPKNHADWLRRRTEGIGGSEIGYLLADKQFFIDHPYAHTPYQVWEKKRYDRECVAKGIAIEEQQNLAMLRGHAYESGVAYMFEQITGIEIVKTSAKEFIVENDIRPYTYASPDRLYWIDPNGYKRGKLAEQNKGVIECKTTRLPVVPDDPPIIWQFQLQWLMGVGGYKEGYLVWDVLSAAEGFGYKKYDFDAEMFEMILQITDDFWQHVLDGTPPDAIIGDDVVRMYPKEREGSEIEVSDEMFAKWVQYNQAAEQRKALEKEEEELKGDIKLFMGDNSNLMCDGQVLATFKEEKKGRILRVKKDKTT